MTMNWEPVVDYLLERMQRQDFKKDDKLPSEHELANRFDLSRLEIRRAYDRLKEMGYVYSLQGKGNYYAGYLEKVELSLSGNVSFSEKMESLKERFYTRVICCERVCVDADRPYKLGMREGEHLLCVKRLRYLDHMPSALHISYLIEERFPDVKEALEMQPSLYAYFESKGYHPASGEDLRITTSSLNMEERVYMGVSGIVPCLMMNSVGRDEVSGEVLEYSTIIYRGDKFIFRL